MKNSNRGYGEWERELLKFVETEPLAPPAVLTEKIKISVSRDLKPVLWKVLVKLAFLQVGCAGVTLFFCPQFKVGFASHDYLTNLVPHSDGVFFMLACGMIFLSGGALTAPVFLKRAEILALTGTVWIYFPAVSLLAVLFFYLAGADIRLASALPWFFGAAFGSMAVFTVVKYFRFRLSG